MTATQTQKDIDSEIDSAISKSDEKNSPKESKEEEKKKNNEEEAEEKMSVMEKYLQKYPLKTYQEGEKMKGEVIQIDNNAVYIDLDKIGTGVVYGKEIKDGFGDNKKKLGIGDEISATVIDLENEEGYIELSIKEALKEEIWKNLRTKRDGKEVFNCKIVDVNKGGLMLEINGVIGFMPVSQLTAEHYPRVDDGDKNKIYEILKTYINTDMKVCVIDVEEEEEKLILSEKEAYKDEEKEAISEFKVGDIVEGEISGVVDFGAFVKFFSPSKKDSVDEKEMLEGLVHISQLDWKLIEDPREIVKVGDKVKVKIISIDDTRISLSMRDLKTDPWLKVGKEYKTGNVVEGTVNKINHFGAFVYLNKDIHGLAHISEFISQFPNKNIDEIIKAGEAYKWEITSLEPIEHRMGLKFIKKGEVSKKEEKGTEKEKKDSKKTKTKEVKKEKKAVKKTVKKATAKKKTKKPAKKNVAKKTASNETSKIKKATKKKKL
jgi:small subunit ribosomal protein S1